ncbi:MAG: helix-turn-helix domain-containing protein [Spirochaetales bacterium]|jgi:transcriptional regulator with XRE-family HTH domain|nr:helix-turn-helix domain-containing protein [Spirochaetales bacterium]
MPYLQKLVGANIKLARTRLKFSQKHLAELVRLSLSTVREIERGARFPTAENLDRFGTALGLRPYKLFYDKEQMELYDKYERIADYYCELNQKINTILDETTYKYLKASGAI